MSDRKAQKAVLWDEIKARFEQMAELDKQAGFSARADTLRVTARNFITLFEGEELNE